MKCRGNNDQCPHDPVDGSDYCKYHGRTNALQRHRKEIAGYKLDTSCLAERHGHFTQETASLTQEIGLLKATLEAVAKVCTSADKAVLMAAQIRGLTESIAKLQKDNIALAIKSREVIPQGEFVSLIQDVATIVAKNLSDLPDFEDRVDTILSEISEKLRVSL